MRVRTHFRFFWPCMDAGWHVIRGLLLDIFCTNMLFRSVLEKEVSWKLPKKGMMTRHDVKLWHLAQVVLLFVMSMKQADM